VKRTGAIAWTLLAAIRAYQVLLSPIFGGNCRYYPSCSHYAHEAVEQWGARRGVWLGIRRLMRCHPFAAGGFDPVPERPAAGAQAPRENRPERTRAEVAL
jgi:uncharacterized protein